MPLSTHFLFVSFCQYINCKKNQGNHFIFGGGIYCRGGVGAPSSASPVVGAVAGFLIGDPQIGTPSDSTFETILRFGISFSSFALPSPWPHWTMPPSSCTLKPFELFIEGTKT